MDIVVLGQRGGETKIILDNAKDFQKSFISLTYVKNAIGESFAQIREKRNQEMIKEKKKLADMEKQAPTDEEFIEAFKDIIAEKKRQKIAKEKNFTAQKKQKKLKSERRNLNKKMKKIKKSSMMKMLFPKTKKPLRQE